MGGEYCRGSWVTQTATAGQHNLFGASKRFGSAAAKYVKAGVAFAAANALWHIGNQTPRARNFGYMYKCSSPAAWLLTCTHFARVFLWLIGPAIRRCVLAHWRLTQPHQSTNQALDRQANHSDTSAPAGLPTCLPGHCDLLHAASQLSILLDSFFVFFMFTFSVPPHHTTNLAYL